MNMIIDFALLIFVIIAGSTLNILSGIFSTVGDYLTHIIPLSNWIGREDTDWFHGWTAY